MPRVFCPKNRVADNTGSEVWREYKGQKQGSDRAVFGPNHKKYQPRILRFFHKAFHTALWHKTTGYKIGLCFLARGNGILWGTA